VSSCTVTFSQSYSPPLICMYSTSSSSVGSSGASSANSQVINLSPDGSSGNKIDFSCRLRGDG
jgi:hypothetical protein